MGSGEFGDIVGDKEFGADFRGVNDEGGVVGKRNGDGRERSVPIRGIGAGETTESDMREGLSHAVGAPDGVGEGFEFCSQGIVDGAAADDEMFNLHESLTLLGNLQGVVDLQRDHCGEGEGRLVIEGNTLGTGTHCAIRDSTLVPVPIVSQRMARRFDADQSQSSFKGADDHHLAGDEVERHAEEGGIAGAKAEEVVGATGGGEHAGFLDQHGLRVAGRAAGLHVDIR